jgi:putative acetyltransferase
LKEVLFRDAVDGDTDALISLIGGVFDEYPGCVMDVDGEMPELRRIASHFRAQDGRFWVAERRGAVVGCVGFAPLGNGGVQLHKLYVRADARQQGIGGALCDLVEWSARERGATHVELWSDTRFQTAHGVYERRGYERDPKTRELHDKSFTVEYFFRRPLGSSLTRAELERAVGRLSAFPAAVRALASDVPEQNLRRKPSPTEFSILENVCHLRDIEREGYSVRLRKLLAEENPFMSDIDGARLARERNYNTQPLSSAVDAFSAERLANAEAMRSLRSEQLQRTGVLESVGEISVERLLAIMQAHDREHWELLRALCCRSPA